MKKLFFLLTLSVLFLVGCSIEGVDSSNENLNLEAARGPVIHHASLGGFDYCDYFGEKPGCDANFSLVANMHADGSVSGRWTDIWVGGVEGVHVDIDCMIIIDNMAVLGGVITKGGYGGIDLTGTYALTAVVDNGTSVHDTPDQMTFSFVESIFENCDDILSFDFVLYPPPLLNISKGEVKVW